ncbi:hypothetical protein BH11PLA2_BH11PLA2_47180 [soil metagenome]
MTAVYTAGNRTLREVLAITNANPGADTITFSPLFNSPQTITLIGSELEVTDSVTIKGRGANLLTVTGNNASRIFNFSNATSTSTLSSLSVSSGKTSGQGGGIFNNSTLTLNNSSVLVSSAGNSGGGIWSNGKLTVTNTTLSGNSGGRGGAIWNNGGSTLTITNSTIAGNANTSGPGGAIYNNSATLTLNNSTITGNSANGPGGGIYSYSSGTVTIKSSIVSSNTGTSGPDITSETTVLTNNCAVGSAAGFTLAGGSANNLAFGTDLKLGPLGDNGGPTQTIPLLGGSPAINTGSNSLNLTTDQRGFTRVTGGVIDIGAVELNQTSIVSINRTGASAATNAASVSWVVTLADSTTGVTASNFTLTGAGAIAASISGVTGSGANYTVTAITGNAGTLTLNFANSTGLNLSPTNLPFAGQSYTVDKTTPTVTGPTTNISLVNDAKVGLSKLSFTAVFSEAMDPTSTPSFSFPVENPGSSFVLASGSWTTTTAYVAVYSVNDFNTTLPNIDVRVSGGKDLAGNLFGNATVANLLTLDTANPIVLSTNRINATNNKLVSVSWDVMFSEAVSGVAVGNFTLFNGGVGGTPAITGVTGSGTTWTVTASTGSSGSGYLGLYTVNAGSVIDTSGNSLAALPVNGPSYYLDFVSPAASQFTLNTLLLSDVNVGPNGFTASLKYNELMDQTVNPAVTFPAEFPNSLTFNGGVWLDASTFQAKFNVGDLGVTQNDIDIRFTGGQDLVGNVQTTLNAVDVFDIDTQNAIISSITSDSPDGTYTVGQTVDVTLNFSEQVNIVGTLNVTLDTGAVVAITGPQSGMSLSGTYTVGSGQTSNDLNVTVLALTGGSTLKDDATNNSVLTLPVSNLSSNAAIIIDAGTGPVATDFIVNSGNAQRSRITRIEVQFNAPVIAADFNSLGAITLTRTAVSSRPTGAIGNIVQTGLAASNHITVTQGTGTSLVLTFDNNSSFTTESVGVEYGSLTDGYWRLNVGTFSSGDTNLNLRRLYGDITSSIDGTVNGSDLFAFGNAFNSVSVAFDFNNDGTINGSDLFNFGNRFSNTL